MRDHRLDFHGTFRRLSYFRPNMLGSPLHADSAPSDISAEPQPNSASEQSALEKFVSGLLSGAPESKRSMVDVKKAASEWRAWLEKYAARIDAERTEWKEGDEGWNEREEAMKGANPRFVLRQWVLEEVIKRVERDPESGKKVLAKVLKVRSILP